MPGRAVVRRAGRAAGLRGRQHGGDERGVHARLVAERHDDRVARGERATARSAATPPALAASPGRHTARARPSAISDATDSASRAEHHDDGVDSATADHRVDGVLQQRLAVEVGQLLGRAEARRAARRRARARRSSRLLQDLGQRRQRRERVAGQEVVECAAARRPCRAPAARSPARALSGFSQITRCAERRRRAISRGELVGVAAVPAVGQDDDDRAAADAPAVLAVERAQRLADARAARPVDDGAGGARQRAVGIAAGELARDARQPRAERERLDAAARGDRAPARTAAAPARRAPSSPTRRRRATSRRGRVGGLAPAAVAAARRRSAATRASCARRSTLARAAARAACCAGAARRVGPRRASARDRAGRARARSLGRELGEVLVAAAARRRSRPAGRIAGSSSRRPPAAGVAAGHARQRRARGGRSERRRRRTRRRRARRTTAANASSKIAQVGAAASTATARSAR